jgi:hypothetical protein
MMDRLLDALADRARFLGLLFTGIGIVFAGYYWLQLTTTVGSPVDVLQYWQADPNNLYPHPELLHENGYNYSPAFELVVGWGRLLPFDAFTAIWRAAILVVLVWLAGPFTVLVLFTVPVASEVNAGNIQMFLAAAIVLAFRGRGWAATWAFVLLTKVTPGIGLLWFALRRRWRDLSVALGVTVAVAACTFVVWPERWFGWVALLLEGSPPPVPPYNLPLLPRLVAAIVIVALAAWRGWRWPVIVGATLALPAFFTLSPSMLVGVFPFVREGAGKWADRRRAARGERLRAQGNTPSGGILET